MARLLDAFNKAYRESPEDEQAEIDKVLKGLGEGALGLGGAALRKSFGFATPEKFREFVERNYINPLKRFTNEYIPEGFDPNINIDLFNPSNTSATPTYNFNLPGDIGTGGVGVTVDDRGFTDPHVTADVPIGSLLGNLRISPESVSAGIKTDNVLGIGGTLEAGVRTGSVKNFLNDITADFRWRKRF